MKTIVALVCLLGIFPGQAQTRSDAQSVPASQTSSETVPEPLPADAPALRGRLVSNRESSRRADKAFRAVCIIKLSFIDRFFLHGKTDDANLSLLYYGGTSCGKFFRSFLQFVYN